MQSLVPHAVGKNRPKEPGLGETLLHPCGYRLAAHGTWSHTPVGRRHVASVRPLSTQYETPVEGVRPRFPDTDIRAR